MDFLKGKKTFFVIGIFLILAVVSLIAGDDGKPLLVVPDWAWALLAAGGLASMRDTIKHLSGNKGWKTYAAVGATVILAVFQAIGLELSPETISTIYTALGAFGIVGVRSALKGISNY